MYFNAFMLHMPLSAELFCGGGAYVFALFFCYRSIRPQKLITGSDGVAFGLCAWIIGLSVSLWRARRDARGDNDTQS